MRGNRKVLWACFLFLAPLSTLCLSALAHAGCGCNKPPPKPAALIPSVASPGTNITFFDPRLQPGQVWQAAFTSAGSTVTTTGTVVTKRDITDPSGKTVDNQLVVAVPNIAPGPTSIQVSNGPDVLAVNSDSFVVIGNPVTVSQQDSEQELPRYTTAVAADGTLYVAVGGLNHVCSPMSFRSRFDAFPLRFTDGDVMIFNWQGYFIDSLTPASHNHFFIRQPEDGSGSDILFYMRHSFKQYCVDHLPGHPKQVDPSDPNWHVDGTPHVDYSTVIFAVTGNLSNGTSLTPGSISAELRMATSVGGVSGDGGSDDDERGERDGGGDGGSSWQQEQQEENSPGD